VYPVCTRVWGARRRPPDPFVIVIEGAALVETRQRSPTPSTRHRIPKFILLIF